MPNDTGAPGSDVAATFKKWREAAGLVQVDAAAQIGVRPSAISRWETGEVRKMDVHNIVGIARVYRQRVEEVVALVTGSPSIAAEQHKRHEKARKARAELVTKAPRATEHELESMIEKAASAWLAYLEITIFDPEARKDVYESGVNGIRYEAEKARVAAAPAKKHDTRRHG